MTTTLSAVTASMVGVVLNLAVWFGLQVIFPGNGVVDRFAILVAVGAFSVQRHGPVEVGCRSRGS